MKHEYSSDELRELKSIYDESGEAGLSRDEMRALRKAGLVKQDLPPEPEKPHEDTLADYQAVSKPTAEPSKRDLILAHCRNRIDQGQPFDGKETAEALGISQKTAGTITVKPQATADPRAIIANALVGIFDAVSALQRTAFQANDKVVYGFATKLLTGELMDIKANYSKDAK